MQARRGAVIERMCQWYLRLNPFETESFQRKRLEERRPCSQAMHSRTNPVQKSRLRKLSRARASSNSRVRFANEHGTTRARQRDPGGKAIGPRSYNCGVMLISRDLS